MSDYLTSLVQRARGETGAVRPIVQPVFAPGRADLPSMPAGIPPEPAAPDALVPPPRARAAVRPSDAGQIPADVQRPPAQTGPDPAANRVSPPPPSPLTGGPQPAAARQDALQHPINATPLFSVAKAEVLTGRQAASPASPAAPAQTAGVTPLPLAEARTAFPAAAQPAQQATDEPSRSNRPADQDAPRSAPTREMPRPAAHVARRQVGRVPASDQIIPVPRAEDRHEPRPAPGWSAAGSQMGPPPAPPAIRVSIGRIEVRAVMPVPPPPPPVAVPAAPLVTLDAYLRERTGRRDR
jgi:hypothetical protein